MECERFKKLLKTWYAQVQNEALAPAKMVIFMQQHVADCRICLMDPSVCHDVDKITEIILPPTKVRVPAPTPKEEDSFPVGPAAEEPEADEEAGEEDSEDEELEDEDGSDDEEEDGDDF